jgi:hypothetical protein
MEKCKRSKHNVSTCFLFISLLPVSYLPQIVVVAVHPTPLRTMMWMRQNEMKVPKTQRRQRMKRKKGPPSQIEQWDRDVRRTRRKTEMKWRRMMRTRRFRYSRQ